MLKYFEIKKAFRYYIKQIDSMLPCVWFSNRSQKTPKCGKNISDTLGYALCATFLFLPHFDIICDLLLNRCMATWNLFVKYQMIGQLMGGKNGAESAVIFVWSFGLGKVISVGLFVIDLATAPWIVLAFKISLNFSSATTFFVISVLISNL